MTAMLLCFAIGSATGFSVGRLICRSDRKKKKIASTADSFLKLLKH